MCPCKWKFHLLMAFEFHQCFVLGADVKYLWKSPWTTSFEFNSGYISIWISFVFLQFKTSHPDVNFIKVLCLVQMSNILKSPWNTYFKYILGISLKYLLQIHIRIHESIWISIVLFQLNFNLKCHFQTGMIVRSKFGIRCRCQICVWY